MVTTTYKHQGVLRAEEVDRLVGKAPVRNQLADYLSTLETGEEVLDLIYLLDGLQTLQVDITPERRSFLQESLGVSLEGENPLVDAVIGAYGRLQEISSDYEGNLKRIQQRQDFREVERAFPTSALDVNLDSYTASLMEGLERLFDVAVELNADGLGDYSKNYEGISIRLVSGLKRRELNIYGCLRNVEGIPESRYTIEVHTTPKIIPAVKRAAKGWNPFKFEIVHPEREERSFFMRFSCWTETPDTRKSWYLTITPNLAKTIAGRIRTDANLDIQLLLNTLNDIPNIPRYLMEMVQSREKALVEASSRLEELPQRVEMDLSQLTS